MDRPFVVTIASEKGGVGKTTLATNLAVYLKALREELPVTIASFDNHFSIDQMFAIGGRRGGSVAALFAGTPAAELASMGEYGVQFLASERQLQPPDDDPLHLRRALANSGLPGILIFDTRPILDYFTRNALLAADLVLVPVKDRPSLVNVASLLRVLVEAEGDPERLWLLPSLIDARLRLRADIGMREFLVFAARERDYQVLDTFIAKSPRVEGLTTSFCTRVYPVLTHARNTAVHAQMRQVGEFVLRQLAGGLRPAPLRRPAASPRAKRGWLLPDCPVCGEAHGGEGFLFQDLRGRRRGVLHPACLTALLELTELNGAGEGGGILILVLEGPGRLALHAALTCHLFTGPGEAQRWEASGEPDPLFARFIQGATGRPPAECFREILSIALGPETPAEILASPGNGRLALLRRAALREVVAEGG